MRSTVTTDREELKKSRLRARMALLVVVTLVVGLAGYIGFRVFREFDVGGATGIGLVVVAATVGIAAFFSPCSFPLLLTALTRQVTAAPERRTREALRFASGASIGAVAFVAGFGLLLSLGGGAIARLFSVDSAQGRILRVVVGIVLIVMGLVQLRVINLHFSGMARLAEPVDRKRAAIGDETKFMSHVLYGFGYLAAGFS
jgi:cytochrome c biogenesis protein CcdA